jgi:S1-C subfamily serine protease
VNPTDPPGSPIPTSDPDPRAADPEPRDPERGVTFVSPYSRDSGVWRPDYSRGAQPHPVFSPPPPLPVDQPRPVEPSLPVEPSFAGAAAAAAPPAPGVAVVTPVGRPSRSGQRRTAAIVAVLCLVSAAGGGVASVSLIGGGRSTVPSSGPGSTAFSSSPTPGARGAVNAGSPSASPLTPTPAASPSTPASEPPSPTASPTPDAPGGATDTEAAIIRAVESVGPAVVTLRVGGSGGRGGSGSGVIVSDDGLILTNRHVIAGASSVTVVLADGRELDGDVKGIDTLTDLALVDIEGDGYPVAPLGESSTLRVGQTVIAMGDPLGEFPGSVTAGIISALDRTVVVGDAQTGEAEALRHLIQTDAAINPGNSGGPLVDTRGRVVGIDTAEARQAEGIGFAIPIDVARPIVAQALAGEPIRRPWLGITFESVDARVAQEEDLGVDHGAWVRQPEGSSTPAVVDGSPADEAGLREGDVITALDGQRVDRDHPLDLLLLAHAPGDRVTLTVAREGATRTVEVVLGERPADLG